MEQRGLARRCFQSNYRPQSHVDVFALGASAYELATAAPLAAAGAAWQALRADAAPPLPPRRSRALDAPVRACLARDAARRPRPAALAADPDVATARGAATCWRDFARAADASRLPPPAPRAVATPGGPDRRAAPSSLPGRGKGTSTCSHSGGGALANVLDFYFISRAEITG